MLQSPILHCFCRMPGTNKAKTQMLASQTQMLVSSSADVRDIRAENAVVLILALPYQLFAELCTPCKFCQNLHTGTNPGFRTTPTIPSQKCFARGTSRWFAPQPNPGEIPLDTISTDLGWERDEKGLEEIGMGKDGGSNLLAINAMFSRGHDFIMNSSKATCFLFTCNHIPTSSLLNLPDDVTAVSS